MRVNLEEETLSVVSTILAAETVLRARYKILDLVGQGGMGAVYQAEDLRLTGRRCAIKEVVPVPNASAEYQEQAQIAFQREASVLARLDHINLPKVSDYFSIQERDYLVMDFVPGQDLREIIEHARFDNQFLAEKDVLNWAEQIINALAYLHQQDPAVLHRDLKPSNIKLMPNGVIKMVDFGLVKLLLPEDEQTVTVVHGQATIQYAPLEQIGGDSSYIDGRADIYSLGGTLYHLLTNEPPPDAKTRYLKGRQDDTPLNIRAINPNVSERTEQAILHALGLHPEDRPTNVEAFRRELIADWPLLHPDHTANNFKAVFWRNRLLLVLILIYFVMALLLTVA